MYQEITRCRICGSLNLEHVLDLGKQALTGIFPADSKQVVDVMPLQLVKCMEEPADNPLNIEKACGLLQLKHNGDLSQMYGKDYGYRSGLNQSMVDHLRLKVKKIIEIADLKCGDLIVDIGSNDSTLLQGYGQELGLNLVGVDPTGKKFFSYYPKHIRLIPDFFSARLLKDIFGGKKAKVITSISMFYDLEDPLGFVQQIYDCLDDKGIWVFEQSYLPMMLETNSYDTVCHEHLEYYALRQIYWLTKKVGLKIIDVEFNSVNGGSFSLTVAKRENLHFSENMPLISEILLREKSLNLHSLDTYSSFEKKIQNHKRELLDFLEKCKKDGLKVFGYGASTKGNVLLQYCGITESLIPYIAEVNENKFGCVTPGTHIPIISEAEAKKMKPDYFLVLPWHFKDSILKREEAYLRSGGRFVFPLPKLTIV